MTQDTDYSELIPAVEALIKQQTDAPAPKILVVFSYQLLCQLEDELRQAVSSFSEGHLPKTALMLAEACALASQITARLEARGETLPAAPAWPNGQAFSSYAGRHVRSSLLLSVREMQRPRPQWMGAVQDDGLGVDPDTEMEVFGMLASAAFREMGALAARFGNEVGASRASLKGALVVCRATLDAISAIRRISGARDAAGKHVRSALVALASDESFEAGGELAANAWRSVRADVEEGMGRVLAGTNGCWQ